MPTHHHHLSSHFVTALLLKLLAVAQAAPWQVQQVCWSGSNYTANSTYQSNIKLLSTTLPKNASTSLFATGEVGTVPDIVYALTLCRGNINASACADCVATAFRDGQQLCAYNKDVTIYDDTCHLRFSNRNFLASNDNGNTLPLMNAQNVSKPTSMAFFDAAVGTLVNTTADYAATNSSKRFGTGEEDFDSNYPKIYSLAQCTPDMSPEDCRSCLRDIISLMPQYFSGRQGARVDGVRCNYRYEVYPFFSGSPKLQLPAPAIIAAPPAPSPVPVNVTPPVAGTGGRTKNKSGKIVAIAVVVPVAVAVLIITGISFFFGRRRKRTAIKLSQPYSINPENMPNIQPLILGLSALRVATNNFAESNKLGEGGFGAVYKGALPDGQEIVVKRLSQSSRQGIGQLKNELILVAKLQHKSLVKVVGICLEEREKLLVYEYMPNRSLDTFIFDAEKGKELNWGKRFKIVNGIARGLQYLHEDSQFRIIHRDLKASNILLDSNHNPKIADFGLAKLFERDQSQDATSCVVGTYGYMAPEYALRGHYSIKSDVFSFGVLILEIVTGRRNNFSSYSTEQPIDLLSLTWEYWTMGTIVDIIDSSLNSRSPRDQILRCVHIGFLCVQDNPVDRPTMLAVNVMLSSNTVSLQIPSRPVFYTQNNDADSEIYSRS